jgi:MoaA/NifB/PqqE/SkfB family radical SAM enzyme
MKDEFPKTVRLWRGKPLRRMHVMVKPTGSLCNLDCSYCYYLSKKELLGIEGHGPELFYRRIGWNVQGVVVFTHQPVAVLILLDADVHLPTPGSWWSCRRKA